MLVEAGSQSMLFCLRPQILLHDAKINQFGSVGIILGSGGRM